jgi:hypothetical protein
MLHGLEDPLSELELQAEITKSQEQAQEAN